MPRTRTAHIVPRLSDIEALVRRIVNNPRELAECRAEAALIRKKRVERCLRLSGQINILDRNKDLIASINRESKSSRKRTGVSKGERAVVMRSLYEEEELKRKFLLANRKQINS